MFRNYLSIAIRQIRQNPLYSFINIFSLAIGLACCLVIYLFITDEKSFDSWHTQGDVIYRLDEVQNFTGTNLQKVALSMPGMGPNMREELPEVKSYARFWNRGSLLLQKEDKRFVIDNVAIVDSTFLEIFDFSLLRGDKTTALDEPFKILLTEETALKFFKDIDDAMGNSITLREKEYKITGILKDVPENSHLQFEALYSMATRLSDDPTFNDKWGSNYVNTYLVLQPNVDIKALEAKLPAFLRKHMDDPDINKFYVLFLQRLDQVHLASTDVEHDYNNYRKFNGEYLNVFIVIGAFILLIASVNFMNLTTARASHRWKEIGVRKSIGAKKTQLFGQLIFESSLFALFALLLAVILDVLLVPLLNGLIGRQLSVLTFLLSAENITMVLFLTAVLGMLSGIYPSFYMTSFKMSGLLKGGGRADGKSIFRSSLVVVQFGLALAMIVSTLIVVQQLTYMKNKDIGFNKDQMLLIEMNKEVNDKYETLKNELLKNKLVQGVTASGQRLGNNFHQSSFKIKADTGIMNVAPSNINVDYDYLKVYGIKLKDGRSFEKDRVRDNGLSFIINDQFAKEFSLKSPLGLEVGHSWYPDDSLGTIIGVTEDFNFNSLHHKINALSIVVHPDWGYDEMTIKVDGANMKEAIAFVKNTYDNQISSFPFTYTFLDQHFENLYRSDDQMGAVVTIMATLAIFISCMGLFGLAAITIERKTKEIGIRKVLGASEQQITFLLSKNFTLLIILSFVIVSPVTYALLSEWLQSFAYRVEINLVLFIAGGSVALLIALATISYHTIRSARANPVKALRYE
jgi:putative ABC transport system permease protein